MRVLFAGTPEIALPSLRLLHEHGYVAAVLSSPDAPKGRSKQPTPSPVKELASSFGLPVVTPERLGKAAREDIRPFEADLLAVVAYGKIFGPKFLELFPRGGVNLHPSLLPKFRGPAPLPATILAGEEEWGLSVQRISLEMDAGDIYTQRSYPLEGRETTAELTEMAAERGAEALLETVRRIEAGTADATLQDESGASYFGLIRKNDGEIAWNLPAVEIDRRVRAFNPWPGAFTWLEGKKLSLWESMPINDGGESESPGKVVAVDKSDGILVQTGSGLLALRSLQLQGKKRLPWKAFMNGVRGIEGATLGGNR